MNVAERRQEVRDATAAVARGKANPRQKKLHDSKIKSAAKRNKTKRKHVCVIFTNKRGCLISSCGSSEQIL